MAIQLLNVQSGATLAYSLPLLVGEVLPPLAQSSIKVSNPTSEKYGSIISWPVLNGNFKALVQLIPGENNIILSYFDEEFELVLYFQPAKFSRFVRPVYIVCRDDSGEFQAPEGEPNSLESAKNRIGLSSRLLQTFTAEKMREHGLGDRTFALETDLYPAQPACHVYRTHLTLKQARSTEAGDLWMTFARDLMSSKQFRHKEQCKWFAFMSFTQYDPPDGRLPKSHTDVINFTKGHAALGGGGLALFGTGNMHCWAEQLEQVIPRFTDKRKIDRARFMDDSAYREFYWANYSTGLGASMHELGHTFDLAHTPTGIMARGFDDLYRVFTMQTCHSRSSSSDGSRLASPIPYSPRQSPIRRPKSGSFSSTKPFPLSRPRLRSYSGSENAQLSVVQLETAFRRMTPQTSQTSVMKNYDGSETRRTTTRHSNGTETITEVTSYPDGTQRAEETIKHVASGKSRMTMSMNMQAMCAVSGDCGDMTDSASNHSYQGESCGDSCDASDSYHTESCGESCGDTDYSSCGPETSSVDQVDGSGTDLVDVSGTDSGTDTNRDSSVKTEHHKQYIDGKNDSTSSQVSAVNVTLTNPEELPPSPDNSPPSLSFQDVKYKDGGAHWYRASAILLAFHKWFNRPNPKDTGKIPELKGFTILSDFGLRLIELRTLPDGVVFHHWEFLHSHPPKSFRLRYAELVPLCQGGQEVTVIAEDNYGNILKHKLCLADMQKSQVAVRKTVPGPRDIQKLQEAPGKMIQGSTDKSQHSQSQQS